jgi:hypothetical protein
MKRSPSFRLTHSQLDNNTVQIEFTLISIVQGLALAVLAQAAIDPISHFDYLVWPYISAGFILILLFWTQAMIHALSFIRWPIDFTHTFLYFLVMFIEVLAFSHIAEPAMRYIFNFIFFLVSGILYAVDLRLMRSQKDSYKSYEEKALFADMIQDQIVSLRLYVPLGLFYTAIVIGLIYSRGDIFLVQNYHSLFALGQTVIGVLVLVRSLQNFRIRASYITAACSEK